MYKPISLLSTFGKILAKIYTSMYIAFFFREHRIIASLQSGLTCDTPVNQLVDVYNIFSKPLNERKDFGAFWRH